MKTFIPLIVLLGLLCSCEKEDVGPPYFRFLPSDEEWFTSYKKGDTITFTSNNAPGRQYVVKSICDSRRVERTSFSFFGPDKPLYYYDTRSMELQRLNHPSPNKSSGSYTIQISRFPLDQANGHPDFSNKKGVFIVSATFDDFNGIWPNNHLIAHSSLNPVSYMSLTLDGKVYPDVAYITSGNPNSYCGACSQADPKFNFNTELRVDKVYYQKRLGVIKFSDLDGATWQIERW
jgi:hypothetical protein